MSLDAIGIICKDIKKSIHFYGLFDIDFQEFGGEDHFEGTTQSGVRIMLDSEQLAKKLNPEWQRPKGSAVVLCFKQESPQQVNDLFKKAIDNGYKSIKDPWDAFWGQRYCSIEDPDGNQVDIFSQLTK